jgi:hypothetical protein
MSEDSTCSTAAAAAALEAMGGNGFQLWQIVLMLGGLAFPTVFWVVAYLIPQLYCLIRPVPDLKKRYNAEWALVTVGKSVIHDVL